MKIKSSSVLNLKREFGREIEYMKKVSVVGRGVDPFKHLSVEAIRILKKADKVFGIEPEMNSWSSLQKEFGLPSIIDLSDLYKDGEVDLNNYNAFINHIYNSIKDNNHIVLLMAGHPRVGVTVSQMLTKLKSEFDFELEFVEGISSFDVMMNELEIDPLEQGTTVLDVNRMLLFKYDLETSLNYFLYHVCSVGTTLTNYLDPTLNSKLNLLQAYLLKFYPAEKVIYLCKASNGVNEISNYIQIRVDELASNVSRIDFGTSLFVPSEKPKKLDKTYLTILKGDL